MDRTHHEHTKSAEKKVQIVCILLCWVECCQTIDEQQTASSTLTSTPFIHVVVCGSFLHNQNRKQAKRMRFNTANENSLSDNANILYVVVGSGLSSVLHKIHRQLGLKHKIVFAFNCRMPFDTFQMNKLIRLTYPTADKYASMNCSVLTFHR